MPKEATTQRKNFKIYQNKLGTNDKRLKTEADEPNKNNQSINNPQKLKVTSAKYEI